MTAPATYAVICGGGTGGHVQPALAIGDALVRKGHPHESLHFVGGRRGIEELVSKAGFPLTRLPGRGIERRLSARNLRSSAELSAALVMAVGLLAKLRPAVVVSVGGYAGLPGALAAVLLRIPLVVVTLDAVPGAANRVVGRFAITNAVAFPGTTMPRSQVTGPPVRAAVLAAERTPSGRARARQLLGVDERQKLVAVTGGSLGARRLNDAVVAFVTSWRDRGDVTVYHVAGERNLDHVRSEAKRAAAGEGELEYKLVGYESEMPALLAACDLVVSRAGASTVAELTVIGVPSVLVPLPGAPSDHQTMNARALAKAGAAIVLRDEECDGPALDKAVGNLVDDDEKLSSMASSARSLGQRDAADRIAQIVEAAAKRR